MVNNNQRSNIIPFHAFAAAARSNATPVGRDTVINILLAQCRDRLLEAVTTSLIKYRPRVSDELLAMAECAASTAGQQCYFSALHILTNRSHLLANRFRDSYTHAFDARVGIMLDEHSPQHRCEDDMPNLADFDIFEQNLAVTKLASRVAYGHLRDLTALEQRLTAALGYRLIGAADTLLHPQLIFSTLAQATREVGAQSSPTLAILSAYERHLSAELTRIYRKLNRQLADDGWLPDITSPNTRAPQHARRPDQARERTVASISRADQSQTSCDTLKAASAHPPSPGRDSADQPAGTEFSDDVFRQLLAALPQSPCAHIPSATPAALDATDPASPADALERLLTRLDRMQSRSASDGSEYRTETGGAWLLRDLACREAANQTRPIDIKTIELMALLFEAMFADPHLSPDLVEELARLQIPLVKVALQDKTFFSNAEHPARRLIDGIATAALGRNRRDRQRLLAKIRAIVDSVVKHFDRDLIIFSTQTRGLEVFLEQELRGSIGNARHIAAKAYRHAHRALATTHADEAIRERLANQSLPGHITEFIEEHWSRVLETIGKRAGTDSYEWQEALRLIDELLWSVLPKVDMDERDRLIIMLPDLLKRLRAGLRQANLESVWDTFFAQLVELHVTALDHRQKGPASAPASDFPAPDNTRTNVPDDPMARMDRLPIGTWVEFITPQERPVTLYLGWIDEPRQQFLFIDRQGDHARWLTAETLEEQLQAGLANPLVKSFLTERALARLFKRRGAAEPAPDA